MLFFASLLDTELKHLWALFQLQMLKFYDSSLEDEKGELRPVSSIFIFDSQKK